MHVLGIDAGGTKTVCLLADEQGAIVAEGRGAGANLHTAGELAVEMVLHEATFDANSREADIAVRFLGETTSLVRNNAGEVVEGSPTAVKKQRDIWTFSRRMGVDDPNWYLSATGD